MITSDVIETMRADYHASPHPCCLVRVGPRGSAGPGAYYRRWTTRTRPPPQGYPGTPGASGAVGISGPQGEPGKDGIGPPAARALIKPGGWPEGDCYTSSSDCAGLGVKDNLCGQCVPLCDRCDADAGFKLVNPAGLRFAGSTFDDANLGQGSIQVRQRRVGPQSTCNCLQAVLLRTT